MPVENGKTVFTVSIEADMYGDGNKRLYEGTFCVRDPKFSDIGAISASVSVMTQGQPVVDPSMGAIMQACALLSVCTEDAPAWWEDCLKVENVPVILAVNSAYMRERQASPFRPASSGSRSASSQRYSDAVLAGRGGRNPGASLGDSSGEPEEELPAALSDEEVHIAEN